MPPRYLPIDVVEDSDSEGETSGLLMPSGQTARGQVAPRRESEEAPACCSASAAGAAALSILAGCAVAAGISALLDDGAPCETGSSRPGAAPAAPATLSPRDGLTDLLQQGHEWIGGAAGGADRFNASERWGAHMRQPSGPSARLLLLGLLSGSDRFVSRDLQRRALWAQRPWEYGVAWRFVVGERLPKGDNSRVSLEYESAKYGDVDRVSGASELPPRLASKALAWLVHASASSRRAAAPPRYVALSSDAHLLRLPRLAALLRAQHTKRPRLYAGALLCWGAWRGGELVNRTGRLVTTWGCVSASAQAQGGSSGDGRSSSSREALSAANGAAWRAAAAGGGGATSGREGKEAVVKLLGSEKARKKLAANAAKLVKHDAVLDGASLNATVSTALDATPAEDAAAALSEQQKRPSHPRFDLAASAARDAYPRDGMVGDLAWGSLKWESLDEAARSEAQLSALSGEEIRVWPPFVLRVLRSALPKAGRVAERQTSERADVLRGLLFLTYMVRLFGQSRAIPPPAADDGDDHHPLARKLGIEISREWTRLADSGRE
mmetsp:Transcript_31573/g.98987  ORF Transcript_31573/g.98987 Transcript_31573/m.98987 type:complete len:553 (+) Transcript_31573:18-1676(+)